MDSRAGSQVIKAKVPLGEMFGYVTQLRTMSSGRANSTMEFSHYANLPCRLLFLLRKNSALIFVES